VTTGVFLVNILLAWIAWAGLTYPALLLPMVAFGTVFLTGLYVWIERRLPMASQAYVNPGLGSVAAPSSGSPSLAPARDWGHRSRDRSATPSKQSSAEGAKL
jgi:hypothetical protein